MRWMVIVTLALVAVIAAQAAKADDDYANTSNEYKAARIALLNAEGVLMQCNGDCGRANVQYTLTAGRYLGVTADLLHQHLMRLDERVMGASMGNDTGVRDELRQQILVLDKEVNDTRNITAGLSAGSSLAQLEAAQSRVQESWNRVDVLTQKVSGRLVMERMETSISQLILLRRNLAHTRESLRAMGMDTSVIDEHLNAFSRDIATAQVEAYKARQRYDKLNDGLNETEVKEFNDDVNAARAPLEQAVNALPEITRGIKEIFEKRIIA